jgi:hypothetical protein
LSGDLIGREFVYSCIVGGLPVVNGGFVMIYYTTSIIIAKTLLELAIDVLKDLGIFPVFSFVAISVAAIYIYRYFTDRS